MARIKDKMITKIKKGYTLTVTSWENDGDHYNTMSKTVDTKEEAKELYGLMQICRSKNDTKPGVGNSTGGFKPKEKQRIIDYLKKCTNITIDTDLDDNSDDDRFLDFFCDLTSELIGSSEFYNCRVMKSCVVTYSEIDVQVYEIKFK